MFTTADYNMTYSVSATTNDHRDFFLLRLVSHFLLHKLQSIKDGNSMVTAIFIFIFLCISFFSINMVVCSAVCQCVLA